MANSDIQSFRIETNRLVIRPIELIEAKDFHSIASRREIAENLASIPHPMSEEDARQWLAERAYQEQPEFVAGIFPLDGNLAGCIGISGNPVTTYYFLAREYWGNGFATEALNPFLDWCAEKFGIAEYKVGVIHDNFGSKRVLEKAGFKQTHVSLHIPPFRDTPDRLLIYWKGYGASEPLTTSTKRLYIHPIYPAHAKRLSELSTESGHFQLLGAAEPPFTLESAKDWISEYFDHSDIYRFAITSTKGRMTGVCELTVENEIGAIKIWIGSEYWQKDFGEDAIRSFTKMAFDRFPDIQEVRCSVTHEDTDLNQVLTDVGFKRNNRLGFEYSLSR